jgi:hypothetical protein
MADAHWKDGCKAMLTVTSIFAGLSGVVTINILTIARPESLVRDWHFYVGASAILFSLFWFVWVAERLTDALDEAKPGIYVDAMYRFNLTVLGVFVSIAGFVSWLDTQSILGKGLPKVTFGDVAAFGILFATVTWGPWWRDAMFLHDRRTVGVDDQGQLIEIAGDSEWNDWIKPLLAKE